MKKSKIFWISFSDLMTSMFFIMLVLFVLAIGYLKIKNLENVRLIAELQKKGEILVKEKEQLEKLLNLEKQFAPLIQDSSSFYYLPTCKKFIVKDLMGVEIFEPNQYVIRAEFVQTTLEVGRKIKSFLKTLKSQDPDLSYLLVIEGNMANTSDLRINKENNRGYIISYQRALAVYDLWVENNINLREPNVEVMLCGSGFNGLCRDNVEDNNKRFSIQLIPKVSK